MQPKASVTTGRQAQPRPERPIREEIAALPLFPGLPLERILVLDSLADAEVALHQIRLERVVGFDTESKPTFTKDAVRDGPHVIQFALRDRAFIVQSRASELLEFVRAVVESQDIVKVGFGLRSDRTPLYRQLGLQLRGTVEMSHLLRCLRYRQPLGVQAAVAIVLKQRMTKSKAITTSNWARPNLRPEQLLYAANDAYAALKVYEAVGSPQPRSPNSSAHSSRWPDGDVTRGA